MSYKDLLKEYRVSSNVNSYFLSFGFVIIIRRSRKTNNQYIPWSTHGPLF